MSQSFSNNSNSFNTTVIVSNNFTTIADDRSNDILAWLSPLDPKLRHQDLRERRVENVGEWLLQTEEFRSWYAGSESGNEVLFCYGDPGVGKTYVSSLVIDRLCDQARGQNATVAGFYFDFAVQKEQSCVSTLRALLKQLVGGLEETPEEISRAFEDQRYAIGGREPGPADIVEMLQIASSRKRTFICIDALDECAARHRVKFLDSLNSVLQDSPGTRVFLTGRPQVAPEIRSRLSGRVMSVSITPRRDDIISYLRTRLDEDTNPDAMDDSLEADILRKIPEDISEIFLLVSLNIDAILQETTIRRRRKKLNEMTNGSGLEDIYGATLGRIKAQGGEISRLGIAALMWISHAERPLKADELCHALAVEIGSLDFDADGVPSMGTLLACCQGLVVVNKEASTVRLIHFTLQEYLRAHPELFGTAHSMMAETCLSYLNSRQVKALSTNPSSDVQDTPFLEYSSLYWGVHARRDLSDGAKSLALKLFDDCNNHIPTKILLKAQQPYRNLVNFDRLSEFTGLHCASFFGIVEIVAILVEVEGCDINQTDCAGNPPLIWAALNGHEGVVQMLCGRGDINPDESDKYGQTSLSRAATNGHEGVAKILLGRGDVDPDKPDNGGRTPLSWAAWNGHEGVVKMLLGRGDINRDEPDSGGRTPLSWAAWYGHEGVVKMLLGHGDINPEKPDNEGRRPLSWAAWHGHEGVVKMLLGRSDINCDEPDNGGRTPLSWAAWHGHERVVRTLLGRGGVNPDKPDNDGRRPISWAAWHGHERVVQMLLGRSGINYDEPDINGRTPLSWAAWHGHEGVVKMLLGHGCANYDEPDNNGRTPLSWAAWHGHEGVVKILLGLGDIKYDEPDNNGRTPLSWAAWHGHEGVVKILLGRDGIKYDEPDNGGRTPLSWAAWHGHEGVVKVLLGLGDIKYDGPDNNGRTPLSWGAWHGHQGVVKILLGQDGIDCDKADNNGRTPFSWAAWHGHEGVVKILLGRDDVNPDKPDSDGRRPLSWAAWHGHEGVVKMLLERGNINCDEPDNDGRTPLSWAAEDGHVGVVKILLGRNINPDRPDNDGRTPLCYAAENGREGVVKTLLRCSDVNSDMPDKLARTPLWWASKHGHAGVMTLLQPPAPPAPSTVRDGVGIALLITSAFV